jgi:hypothetical protein
VPNLQYTRPLWELVSTGTIDDKTPFTVPKFSSASGLVGDHTEGTEPTPGAFAATGPDDHPGAMSGKIEINREVWDQGGSPQADGIIWGEMLNGWYEAIEAKIAAPSPPSAPPSSTWPARSTGPGRRADRLLRRPPVRPRRQPLHRVRRRRQPVPRWSPPRTRRPQAAPGPRPANAQGQTGRRLRPGPARQPVDPRRLGARHRQRQEVLQLRAVLGLGLGLGRRRSSPSSTRSSRSTWRSGATRLGVLRDSDVKPSTTPRRTTDGREETLQYERATPIRYQLTATGDPVAAYLCTHTEIQD